MGDLIKHLESHLGRIQGGCNTLADGSKAPFQVVECTGGMLDGVVAYSTLGLGRHPLKSAVSDKIIRHELFILSRGGPGTSHLGAALQDIALEAVESGMAYLAGQVIGPRGKLFKSGSLEALYVTMPCYFPDSFATCVDEVGNDIVMAWVVPITSREADFARQFGLEAFEAILAREDPDMLDFDRTGLDLTCKCPPRLKN